MNNKHYWKHSDRQTRDTLTLLKMLALGNRQIKAGKVQPARDVIQHIRKKRAAFARV